LVGFFFWIYNFIFMYWIVVTFIQDNATDKPLKYVHWCSV
jgi:hypothetical protein